MTEARRRIIDRIKALMARGDSSFEEEARTSLHMAHKLMKQHGVTFADLAGATSPGTGYSPEEAIEMATELIAEERRTLASMGGQARAAKLTPKRRTEIARKAALKRWGWQRQKPV